MSIGEAWHLLDAAADEIERLQADAHALAAERLCRAVEVAVLMSIEEVNRSNFDTAEWALREMRDVKNRRIEDLANEYWRGYWAGYYADQDRRLDESARAPEARKEEV